MSDRIKLHFGKTEVNMVCLGISVFVLSCGDEAILPGEHSKMLLFSHKMHGLFGQSKRTQNAKPGLLDVNAERGGRGRGVVLSFLIHGMQMAGFCVRYGN